MDGVSRAVEALGWWPDDPSAFYEMEPQRSYTERVRAERWRRFWRGDAEGLDIYQDRVRGIEARLTAYLARSAA